ncbi:MYB DNA-binding domain protein [Cordyceps fumosorosea ARSEF 2679]|uniref:MYB DNA-binding domain protein n=1 Tax=Cordyceps fumosorosea (strain ARSEF 2679) TaxID=1081104 RepID=A0A167S6K8_CORFA|nr:MYB DNA-binding domain protein [Cordyceps fumosorosea ARSEF 2679]OAA59309.1 MYB DNA-binding domain protein [Cordyceps fumosorosea ARSEF 2679]
MLPPSLINTACCDHFWPALPLCSSLLSTLLYKQATAIIAVVAQIETQSLLCLSRAEVPYSSTVPSAAINLRSVSRSGLRKPTSRRGSRPTITVDIASLIKREDSDESKPSAAASNRAPPPSFSSAAPAAPMLAQPMPHGPPPLAAQMSHHHIPQLPPRGGSSSNRRHLPPQGIESHPHPQQPVKKQTKWSAEEDVIIIELRGKGMKWDDVSKHLPGRSSISCRLHYQNYLERRSEWDEERKNKLARLYDRFKAEMWAKVAEELQVPWRAAEAMHWQLGEQDMARRAGQTPFALAHNAEAAGRNAQIRGHAHTHSQESVGREMRGSPPQSSYGAIGGPRPPGVLTRRDAAMQIGPPPPHPMPTSAPIQQQQQPPPPSSHPAEYNYKFGHSLPPIQPQPQPQPQQRAALPSVLELTEGVTPYSTPPSAHLSGPPPPPPPPSQQGMHHGIPPQHAHQQPGQSIYADPDHGRMKRPGSPDGRLRESNYRRRMQ